MNKRIKKKKITLRKKREQKILKGFIKTIKHACLQILTAPVPPTPSFEQQCRMIENAYHKVCENAGYAVSDTVLPELTEDALVISDYAAEQLQYNMVDIVDVDIKKDSFLLNKYGRNGEYKPFPDIGEEIVFSQSDHPGVINGEITLKPNYFPIDIKVIKGRRLTPTESDLVAVQDPIDTSEIDIGTL